MNLKEADWLNNDLERLERSTRGISSRRMEIPPTPRDTLAVLRQAAETQCERRAASGLSAGLIRALLGVTAAIAFIAGAWSILSPTHDPAAIPAVLSMEIFTDPGMDLADWELEFEAIREEVDLTLTALETQEDWEAL